MLLINTSCLLHFCIICLWLLKMKSEKDKQANNQYAEKKSICWIYLSPLIRDSKRKEFTEYSDVFLNFECLVNCSLVSEWH